MISLALVHVLVLAAAAPSAGGDPADLTAQGSSRRVDASRKLVFGLQWRQPVVTTGLFRQVGTTFGMPGVSTAHASVIVATGEGDVQSRRLRDGTLLWTYDHGEPFETAVTIVPAAGKGRELALAGSRDGTLVALDTATGALVWKTDVGGEVRAPAAIAGTLVVVQNAANRVLALEAATGKAVWSAGRPAPTALTVVGHARPVVDGNTVYASFSDGWVAAFALADGAQRWQRPLSLRGGEFTDADADPVVAGGRLYVASYSDGVYALSPTDGQTIWTRYVPAVASLAAHGDNVIAGSGDGFVWAFRQSDGELAYRTKLASGLVTRMQVEDDLVVFAGGDSGLVVLDARDGRPLQATGFGTRMIGDPAWVRDAVAVLSAEGFLYAFARGSTGRVR